MSEVLYDVMNGGEFFAAANSAGGFVSFYDRVFAREGIEKRYLIKGGPGTGKSSFMRKVAERATEEGLAVEYYRCSSDPDSLDGIIVEGRVALLDATAPHEFSPTLAGAVDETVDLGSFWRSSGLEGERDEIKRLSLEKGACYAQAYDILGAVGGLERACRRLVAPLIDHQKLDRMAESILKRLPSGKGGELKVALRDSVGMKGRVRLDGYERLAHRTVNVNDVCGVGDMLLERVLKGALSKGLSVRVSYDPVMPSRVDALLIEDTATAFVIGTPSLEGARAVNMRRAVITGGEESGRIRREYKRLKRLSSQLVGSAVSCLEHAGTAHFALERIYVRHMDFDAESRFCRSFAESVINRLISEK